MFENNLTTYLLYIVGTIIAVFLVYLLGKGWYVFRKKPVPHFQRCLLTGALIMVAIGIPLSILIPLFAR